MPESVCSTCKDADTDADICSACLLTERAVADGDRGRARMAVSDRDELRRLFLKYMKYIIDREGVDFLDDCRTSVDQVWCDKNGLIWFDDREWRALMDMRKERVSSELA